jgi:hypothetical protein
MGRVSLTDQARVTKHVDEFLLTVDDLRRDPTLDPD